MNPYLGLLGILVLIALCYLLSYNPRRVSVRMIAGGVGLQFAVAWALLRFPPLSAAFDFAASVFNRIISFAEPGSRFLFGELVDVREPWGFLFAFRVLPVIIFFASFMSVLYHFGIMQRVIASLAWLLRGTVGVTGAEAMSVSANIFVGQTEAPLCVKPFVASMTRSQLLCLMTGGFATIAGSVMAAYVGLLGGDDPAMRVLYAKHLMIASVMSAPAALVCAKIILPETENPVDERLLAMRLEQGTRNVFDAAAAGATDGLRLAANVAAMLAAFVALLALVNYPLEALSDWAPVRAWREAHGVPVVSLQQLLGWLLAPLAWTLSVPWEDCGAFGALLGEKLIATEFIAYTSLAREMHAAEPMIGDRAAQIATYALCGFANFPSIAIQIGGLTGIAPSRRSDFAMLGLRAMLGGAFASWMTAAVASVFLPA